MTGQRINCALGLFVLFAVMLPRVRGADFEVTTTADQGFGSLRQAILDANDNPGLDRVVFNIPGAGVHTIQPVTPLPPLSDPLVIDGYTQPGASVNTLSNGENAVLLIQLDGVLMPFGTTTFTRGLWLTGGTSTLRGLVINRFAYALYVDSGSNMVTGNFIGPDPAGLDPLSNGEAIYVGSVCCNVFGGRDPADRNLISGNGGRAFYISENLPPQPPLPPAVDTVILGNFIGTDRTGLARMAGQAGTSTFSVRSSLNLTIGGLEPGAGNVVAPGIFGVHIYYASAKTRILGNFLGVGVDGITSIALTNTDVAIAIEGSPDVRIEANRIAYGAVGVVIRNPSVQVTLSRNQIYSNSAAGISLGPDALVNDAGDLDGGPNGQQNFPVLKTAGLSTDLLISGSMESKPSTAYHLEFFANAALDTNGQGEGEIYLGSTEVTTPDSGVVPFTVQFPRPLDVYYWITATATDPDGNTSIFSPPVRAQSTTFLQVFAEPLSAAVPPGSNATFRIDVSGAQPILYQWRQNGVDLDGATNATLSLTNVQIAQRGFYSVRVSNPLGSLATTPVELVVLIPPILALLPMPQTIAPGEYVTLSALVTNTATLPITYRWRSNGTFFATAVSTQYSTFITVRPVATTTFQVVVSNAAVRTVVAGAAQVVVGPDRDLDGLPDLYETNAGLNPDDPADGDADADSDGFTNWQEYFTGTDPRDGKSGLRIQRIAAGPAGTILELATASNKTYSVQYRETATRIDDIPWQTLTNLPARKTNSVVFVGDEPGPRQRYYRLVSPMQPASP